MPKKKPTRGSGVSVTLPTEPLAGNAKTTPIMAVMVQDEGTPFWNTRSKRGSPSSSASAEPPRRLWSGLAQRRTAICSSTRTGATWSR